MIVKISLATAKSLEALGPLLSFDDTRFEKGKAEDTPVMRIFGNKRTVVLSYDNCCPPLFHSDLSGDDGPIFVNLDKGFGRVIPTEHGPLRLVLGAPRPWTLKKLSQGGEDKPSPPVPDMPPIRGLESLQLGQRYAVKTGLYDDEHNPMFVTFMLVPATPSVPQVYPPLEGGDELKVSYAMVRRIEPPCTPKQVDVSLPDMPAPEPVVVDIMETAGAPA